MLAEYSGRDFVAWLRNVERNSETINVAQLQFLDRETCEIGGLGTA
ncbi:MAG: hypothetical protein Q8R02_18960 [Hyphomonadaceae bacterium]|nr:hypothetical protein [Hyphomonadaceae bacterium]